MSDGNDDTFLEDILPLFTMKSIYDEDTCTSDGELTAPMTAKELIKALCSSIQDISALTETSEHHIENIYSVWKLMLAECKDRKCWTAGKCVKSFDSKYTID